MDVAQITEVLGLASTALGTTEKATRTVGAIKSLFESEKAPDKKEAADLLNDLASELTAANILNLQLSDRLKAVSRALEQEDSFLQEKARYELIETQEGDMVFRLRNELAEGQPIHFICPVCLNRDRMFSFISGEGDFKRCQTAREHLFRFRRTPSEPARPRGSYF